MDAPPPSTFWPQERSMKSCSVEKKVSRPQKEQGVNCPRCSSTNTKFCYYNNYSLSQPRHFCKTCRRYWTEGGSLRNIPVGGGSRKNKKPSSANTHHSTTTSSSSSRKIPEFLAHQQNPKPLEAQDLSLGFSVKNFHVPSFGNASKLELLQKDPPPPPPPQMIGSSPSHYSFVPLPFIACGDPAVVYSSGFPSLPELIKPTLNFSLDAGLGSNYGSFQGGPPTNMKELVFPFEGVKQGSSRGDQNGDQNADSIGIWNGVLGGGSW